MVIIMKLIKKKTSKSLRFYRVAVLSFIGYVGFTLVNQQIQIDQKKKKIHELSEEIKIQQMKNDQLRSISNSDSEEQKKYIERVARSNLDFSKKGERIFVNVSGDSGKK